jgi:RNA polymerase sigma-70 factor (ECF subfamily)
MSLPSKQRATIVLCDNLGFSREEAASAIGASVASVKTELHRARKTMTEVFETRCALVNPENECTGCHTAGRIRQQQRAQEKSARNKETP